MAVSGLFSNCTVYRAIFLLHAFYFQMLYDFFFLIFNVSPQSSLWAGLGGPLSASLSPASSCAPHPIRSDPSYAAFLEVRRPSALGPDTCGPLLRLQRGTGQHLHPAASLPSAVYPSFTALATRSNSLNISEII